MLVLRGELVTLRQIRADEIDLVHAGLVHSDVRTFTPDRERLRASEVLHASRSVPARSRGLTRVRPLDL